MCICVYVDSHWVTIYIYIYLKNIFKRHTDAFVYYYVYDFCVVLDLFS